MSSNSNVIPITSVAVERGASPVTVDPASRNIRWTVADDESTELWFGTYNGEKALLDVPDDRAAVATASA